MTAPHLGLAVRSVIGAWDQPRELFGQGSDRIHLQASSIKPWTTTNTLPNMAPEALLSHLHRADGSATYLHNGYSIIGAVNGPIEVQRRDEIPEEAFIEVNVRPSVGVGSRITL